MARHRLGCLDIKAGNIDKSIIKHHMFEVGLGHADSLKLIQAAFGDGYITKDDYEKALRSYQQYIEEVRSEQRNRAAAFHGKNKYLTKSDF